MTHIDIKKLGRFNKTGYRTTGDSIGQSNSRGVGWEFVHVCIDYSSRVASWRILPGEKKESTVVFLEAALTYYKGLSAIVQRVMTDNYRSRVFRKACKASGLKHVRSKLYTPKTNGKAERFIQTALQEWAYATALRPSRRTLASVAAPIQLARVSW